jgi:hypothetical protein
VYETPSGRQYVIDDDGQPIWGRVVHPARGMRPANYCGSVKNWHYPLQAHAGMIRGSFRLAEPSETVHGDDDDK